MQQYEKVFNKHKNLEAYYLWDENEENFMFRWDPYEGQFQKPKGRAEIAIPLSHALYNEAKSYGVFVTKEEYDNF